MLYEFIPFFVNLNVSLIATGHGPRLDLQSSLGKQDAVLSGFDVPVNLADNSETETVQPKIYNFPVSVTAEGGRQSVNVKDPLEACSTLGRTATCRNALLRSFSETSAKNKTIHFFIGSLSFNNIVQF